MRARHVETKTRPTPRALPARVHLKQAQFLRRRQAGEAELLDSLARVEEERGAGDGRDEGYGCRGVRDGGECLGSGHCCWRRGLGWVGMEVCVVP